MNPHSNTLFAGMKEHWSKRVCVCGTCKQEVESVDDADECEQCRDEWEAAMIAYYRPLYEGEKLAGLTKRREDAETAIGE